MRAIALLLRFLLELVALAAIGYGGWSIPDPVWARALLAAAFVAGAIAIWSRWVAPRAAHKPPDPQRLLPEWLVFGGATAALIATGHWLLAVILAVLAAADRLALWRLGAGTGGESLAPRRSGPHFSSTSSLVA
ncbi:YrdB family protein [Asanoa sp. NPDC049518]|uniref:YrdB family protein n=1 Tax=unclassified Asanoa TaxID=2685164 RepID=UPI003417F06C